MNWILKTLSSSIGKKVLVALSGLGLLGFMFAHLYGNLQIYKDNGAGLDEYAHHLHEAAWLGPAEIGLLFMLILHVTLVIQLVMDNRGARGINRYKVTASKRDKDVPDIMRTFASKLMAVSGIITLLFLVIHIADLRAVRAEYEGQLGQRVIAVLSDPSKAMLYIVGSFTIGFHLSHGIQSAVRSLGIAHDKYSDHITKGGMAISMLLSIGFASIPIAILMGMIG